MSQDIMSLLRDDPVLGRYVEHPTPPVQAALAASEGLNTERLARERRLSASLGVPPRLIRPHLEKAEQEDMARRIQADPVLGRYAGLSPENAALVRDDEQGLRNLVSSTMSDAWESAREAGRDLGEAWDAGDRQMELAELGNRLADGDESAQAEIDAWYAREAGFPQRDSFADTLGLTSAVTQLPRMLTRDIPTSAGYGLLGAGAGAGGGALAGAAFGGVGAGPGALAGARLGGKAGWLAGTAKTSYDSERGSFAAELSQERDENGLPLDPAVRNAAASLYGAAAAAVETLGEAVFMKLLSPLAGRTLGKLGVKPFLRSAVKGAIWDKSVQAAVLDLSKRIAGGALTEGAEESVQRLMSIIAESMARREATVGGVNAFRAEGLLPPGSGKEALEAGVEGMKAGLWLSGGPTAVLGAAQVREARRVAAWNQAQKDAKAKLDQTKIGAASPELAEGFLRRGKGVTGTVTLPADAVLELHQSGLNILEPLGWQAQDVADAAALGQDLETPLSQLHARLDAKTFDAVADIMRPEPEVMSAAEAANLEERLREDVEDVNAAFAEYQAERNAIDAEVELLRNEVAGAVGSVPNLKTAIEGMNLTPDAAAETYIEPLLNFAERLREHAGLPVAETLRKLRTQGLVRDGKRLLTPDEMLEREEARTKAEAEKPFWDAVWGRLDGQSLKRDYPDAWRELSRLHGPGLFAKKGGGLAIDELADEMETAYLLTQGGGGDALVERLKQGKKPSLRMRQGKGLFQEDRNPLAARFADMPMIEADSSAYFGPGKEIDAVAVAETPEQRKTLRDKLKAWAKKRFPKTSTVPNADTGWQVRVTPKGIEDSLSHGFDELLARSVPFIPQIIEGGVHVASIEKKPGLMSHIFANKIRLDGQDYVVGFVLREDDNGNRFYDHELTEIINPDWLVPGPALQKGNVVHRTNRGDVMNILRDKLGVNDGTGHILFQPGGTADARGSIKPTPDGHLIQLYQKADLSTLLHEMGHFFLLEVDDAVRGGLADDALKERLKQGKKPDRTLFQPLNEGVDLDAPVAVVEVMPRFAAQNPKVLRKRFPDDVRRAVLAEFDSPEGVVNADTGWRIDLSARDFREHLKFEDVDVVGGVAQLEAIAALPALMRNARLVESYADKKNAEGILQMHRFQGALRVGEKDYSVKLTVKEYKNGFLALDSDTPLKLYHHRLEKEMPAGNSASLSHGDPSPRPSAGIHEYSLRALLEDVKDSEGQAFFQKERADARGSIKPTPDGHLIQLYQKADLSTLLHEMGHFFLLEVDDAVRGGLADDALKADYAALRQWLKAEDGAELTREQHEQFARGFEAYLMEGKAPSVSLESAFARFKKWLTRIYQKARALNVDLTDEVRGVFERLLATETEVNARAVENGLTDLTTRELDALGLKGAERVAVSGLMRAARDAAEARMREDRDRQRREQIRQWTAEAKAEVDADPLYGAMKDARTGGLDLEAVRQDMGEGYTARLMKRLPGTFRKEGGADPALFAAEHSFRDPAQMFTAMLDAPHKAARVRELVDAKQQAWDANFDPADYLLETDEAAKQMELVGRYVARAMGGQAADQRALKRVAAEKLAAMTMGKAAQPGTYRMNMRRALAAERRAIAKGDWRAALDANFKARINMEFARQSLELKRSVETLQGRIKRFTGMARADPDARFLVGALAQRHGLGRLDARLATEERQNPGDVLAAWIEGAKADGCPVIMDNAFARPDLLWRDMSVETFEQLAETVGQIVTVERNRRKLLTAQGKADLDEAAEEIAAGVAAFRESAPVKTVEKENPALKSLKGLHAIHAKVEALCLALDGDKQGPMWEYVYRPVTKAEDDQSGRLRTARDKLRRLFGVFSRKELSAMRLKREYVAGVGEKLTRENMIALALNMGNETNIARVREGHGWTDAQIGDVLSRLTRKDWDFVQSVWDYFETFRDASFKLQEDVTGLRPQAVEARPLTVTTADGHTLTLRGGYFPIRYNAEKGFLAFEREQRELDQELFGGNNHSAAMTRQGHLKERARKGTGEPLLLELSVVTDHVFNVIHDLSYRRAVLDVAKVIRHPKVREALAGAVGMDMVNQLKPWLMDVANERQEPMHAVHRWANWARASTSIMQMGWKVTTMLAQPLGILQTAEALGYGYTAAGLKKVYGNLLRLPELLEETFARSPMMADRIRSFDREIRDMTKKLMPSSGLFGWVDKVRDSAFVPIGVMQMGVDLPTWWGGYAKGLRDFQGDEARAAEYADSVVRMSQGSGSTKDLARVQRGGPLPRLFTMFYSYFNTFYNLAARRVTALRKDHSPAAVFRAANTALLLWFVPAVLGELMAGRGPDDDDEWDEWAGMLILQYPFQAVVGVRDVANHVFGEYGYQITPAQAAPKALGQWFKSVNKALEEENAGRLAKPTVEAAGYLFGLPMKQPIITVGNIWDYLTGEDPEFEVRDLFFVKPRDRR